MRVLVVVDMQNDFIDGALGTKEAEGIVSNVVRKIREFDGMVVATQDTHSEKYLETQEGRLLPVLHCVAGTEGWEIQEDVLAAVEERAEGCVLQKPTFGSLELGNYLRELNEEESVEEIVLVGLCTDICVISNAMIAKAALPEVKITVDASCCAGVTPESHQRALEAMQVCQICVEL